jgi:hypothetical protein
VDHDGHKGLDDGLEKNSQFMTNFKYVALGMKKCLLFPVSLVSGHDSLVRLIAIIQI